MSENFYSSFGQGTQINTSTLEVTSLNQEFVAGEDITAGDAVCLQMGYRDGITTTNITGTPTTAYITKPNRTNINTAYVYVRIYIGRGQSSGGYTYLDVSLGGTVIKTFEIRSYGEVETVMGGEFTFSGTATNFSITVRGYGSPSFNRDDAVFVFQKTETPKVVKAKLDTSSRKGLFLGIANNSALTGETVQVALNGTAEIQGIEMGKCYQLSTTTTGVLQENTDGCNIVGVGIGENKFAIQKGLLKLEIHDTSSLYGVAGIMHRINRKAIAIFNNQGVMVKPIYNGYDCVVLSNSGLYYFFFE